MGPCHVSSIAGGPAISHPALGARARANAARCSSPRQDGYPPLKSGTEDPRNRGFTRPRARPATPSGPVCGPVADGRPARATRTPSCASSASTRSWTARSCCSLALPLAAAGWFDTHTSAQPASASRRAAAAAPGSRRTSAICSGDSGAPETGSATAASRTPSRSRKTAAVPGATCCAPALGPIASGPRSPDVVWERLTRRRGSRVCSVQAAGH
jgi:hypothetical protein